MTKVAKIDLHELMRIKEKREMKNLQVFNHILNLCYKKIRHIAEHGGMSLYYNIPRVEIGFPLYNHNNCIEYISKQLAKSGLYVANLPPPNHSYIYISWKLEDISQTSNSKGKLQSRPKLLQ